MKGSLIAFASLLTLAGNAKPVPPAAAAEYYYRQHDFSQALPLWQEVLRREPDNVTAAIRVVELSYWVEGRASVPDRFTGLIEGRKISRENRLALKKRFWELQNSFLTDQAQNLFLQAKHRTERHDWLGALEFLNQASDADRGQFAILRAKAEVEKNLGYWNLYYQTLRAAVRSYPYDAATLSDFAEAHIFFKNFDSALEVLKKWDGPMEPDQKTLLAVALAETDNRAEALTLLRSLTSKGKHVPHPVLYDAIGQVLARSPETESEARKWFEKFVETAAEAPGWDPYRMTDRIVQARRILTQSGS